MAKVTIAHPGISDPEAKTPPRRDAVPEGRYAALITVATLGKLTWSAPPVDSVKVEFQLMYRCADDADDGAAEGAIDETEKGRRVFQDFALAPVQFPDLALQHRFELRQLLDACSVELDPDGGFDTEDLEQKSVFIKIKHRKGKEKDPETDDFPIFTNVYRIESAVPVDPDDLL